MDVGLGGGSESENRKGQGMMIFLEVEDSIVMVVG